MNNARPGAKMRTSLAAMALVVIITTLSAKAGAALAATTWALVFSANPQFGAPAFAAMSEDGAPRTLRIEATTIGDVSLWTEDNKDLVTPEALARKHAELLDENRRLLRENERLLRDLSDALEENRRILGEVSRGR